MKKVLISRGILFVGFSGNALQSFIHINFTAMLVMIGGGVLAWWMVVKIMGGKNLESKND